MPGSLGMIIAVEQSQPLHQIVDEISHNVLKKSTWKHKSVCTVACIPLCRMV